MKRLFTILIFILFSTSIFAQYTLSGAVNDSDNQAIAGANVTIKGLFSGSATDAAGKYNIAKLKTGNYTVVVSFIGYKELEKDIEINDKDIYLDFSLEKSAYLADEVTVSATRAGEKTPISYTNITKEELAKNNIGQDLPYLLEQTPSVVVSSDGGTGIGYTGIRIRGSDPTRVNVTINGIPLNDAESQGTFWVDLPDMASSTSNIQIQRGVGTSTHGAGAFGGTINVQTSSLNKDAYATINNTIGSFNTWKHTTSFGTGLIRDNFTVDGRLSRIISDGYVDRASSRLNSYYVSAAYFGNKRSLRLNVFSGKEVTYQAWNGLPKAMLETDRTFNSAGTEKEGEPYDNEVDDYIQTHAQLLYADELTRNLTFNAALHYTKGEGFYEQYKADEAFGNYGLTPIDVNGVTIDQTDLIRRRWLDNDFYGTTFSLDYLSDNRKLKMIFGGAWNQYLGRHFGEIIWSRFASDSEIRTPYYDNDATKSDLNFFAKTNYQMTSKLNLFVDLQYRGVNYEFLGFDNDLNNVAQTAQLHFFNPKAGLFFDVTPQLNFYVSYAMGNREPNRNDYTESTPNSRPKHETLHDIELGGRKRWNKAFVSANLFGMFYKNQLALTGEINDVGAATRQNIDKSYRAGIELQGGIKFSKMLSWNANLTFSQNKIQAFTEYLDVYDVDFNWLGNEPITYTDTDLAFSPNIVAGSEITFDALGNSPTLKKHNDLTFSLLSKYVGKQFISNSSTEEASLNAYFLNDVRINYTFKHLFFRELGVTLMAKNIFNTEYESNAWVYRGVYDGAESVIADGYYPQAGRMFFAGLTIGF